MTQTLFHKLNVPKMDHPAGFTIPNVRSLLEGGHRNTDSWRYNVEDVMSKSLLDFFKKECQLTFDNCFIFFVRAGFSTDIHLDGTVRAANVWAVNFIQDGMGSKINWYNKTNARPVKTFPNLGGAIIDSWEEEDLVLAKTYTLDHDRFLIRTDFPHKVINCTDNNRWCFSFRGEAKKHTIKTWHEVINSLRKYI